MRRAGRIAVATFAAVCIACVSQRERRQSSFSTAHETVAVRQDSAWYRGAFAGKTLELLEVEAPIRLTGRSGGCYAGHSGCYFRSGGLTDRCTGWNGPAVRRTDPAEVHYLRMRRLTLRADSGTVSGGSVSKRDSATAQRKERETASSRKRTRMSLPWWVWALACLLVMLSVYRLLRRVNR